MSIKIKFSKLLTILLMLAFCLTLVFTLVACGNGQTNENGDIPDNGADIIDSDGDEPIDRVSNTVKDIIFQVINKEISFVNNIYFAEDEPDKPKKEDLRIDSITYQGHAELAKNLAAAFLVESSLFFEKNSWGEYVPFYVVIERTAENDGWLDALGVTYDTLSQRSSEAIVLEAAYNLWDIDVAIRFDYNKEYWGPGSRYIFLNEDHEVEYHYDYEPTYNKGDYWLSYHFDGLSTLVYHNEYEGYESINRLEVTRADCETYRGIRVGSTREEVFAAYPEITDLPYWGFEGDYVWYNRRVDDFSDGLGVSILFWFTDNKVSKLDMINMFN